MTSVENIKHPKSTYLLSTTAMLESFSFYIYAGLLVLFMIDVLHFSNAFSLSFFGLAFGSTYLLQIIGGFLCDKYLGNRKSVIIGIVLIFIGQLIFTYDASLYALTANVATHSSFIFNKPEIIFLIGIFVISIGGSFFRVTLASFFSLFYKDNENGLDSAFSIFYMFINFGGFFAPLLINYVVGVHHPELYQYGFLIAAIIMFIGLIIFLTLKNKLLVLPNGEAVGIIPRSKIEGAVENVTDSNIKLNKIEIDRLKVIFLMLILVTVYLAGNQQIFSSMIIFAENNVNNVLPIINQQVAPQFYLILNPLFITFLSPLYIKLANSKKIPSITSMGLSLIVLGLAFLIMVIGMGTVDGNMRINMIWMVIFSLLLVNSELLIIPVSLSLVSKLAPKKFTSMIIGIYYLVFFIGEVLAGLYASALPTHNPTTLFGFIPIANLSSFFLVFVVVGFALGGIWLLFGNKIKNLTHEIE